MLFVIDVNQLVTEYVPFMKFALSQIMILLYYDSSNIILFAFAGSVDGQ